MEQLIAPDMDAQESAQPFLHTTAALDNVRLDIAFFNNKRDNAPKQKCPTLDELRAVLTNHSTRANKDGPLLAPASFKQGSTRAKENVETVSCFVLDFDDGTNPLDATRALDEAGYCYIIYTTYSHTREHPKFRVVVPLARPIAGKDWPDFWLRAAMHFGRGEADKSAKDASRIYYLPSCTPEGEAEAYSFYFPGTRLLHPDDVPAAPQPELKSVTRPKVPATAADNLRPYVIAAFSREVEAVRNAPNGHRNSTLNKAAYSLGQIVAVGELTEEQTFAALTDAALTAGLPESEARATIRSGIEGGKKAPRQLPTPKVPVEPARAIIEATLSNGSHSNVQAAHATPSSFALNDIGNGQRFAAQHGASVRFCHAWGRWIIWDTLRWRTDENGAVEQLAKETALSIADEARQAPDDQRPALLKHAATTIKRAGRETMLKDAASEPGIPVAPNELDADPFLINVQNVTIDLRTRETRPHNRRDLLTKVAPVAYDPHATCPLWRSFTNEITDGRPHIAEFLQRAVGYSLSGDTREQMMIFLHGIGANGKSTFLETLLKLLGDYALQTDSDLLLAKAQTGGVPNDVARLRGARFIAASETEDGRRLAESRIKALTGSDTITARFLHQEFFDFKMTGKIWLATNHRPMIRGTDHAMWRRVRLVPFDVIFDGDRRDPALPAKLIAELPGILNWALDGAIAWQRDGLAAPAEVQAATNQYRAEMDIFGAFLGDCCMVAPNCEVTTKAFYNAFRQWCDDNGEREQTQTRVGKTMRERGFEPARGRDGRNIWRGVGLKVI
jgi:P4 family phage/plasmid primase-like protien